MVVQGERRGRRCCCAARNRVQLAAVQAPVAVTIVQSPPRSSLASAAVFAGLRDLGRSSPWSPCCRRSALPPPSLAPLPLKVVSHRSGLGESERDSQREKQHCCHRCCHRGGRRHVLFTVAVDLP
ncbi:uncharacterized protein DS421_20g697850 [Arachis hypogaea]|nr:uncharacterized protein DS421_20g697850 [Arachis hypogaea]